jgi:hypothetical protein
MEIGSQTLVLFIIECRYDMKNPLVSVQASSYKLKGNDDTLVKRTNKINIPTRARRMSHAEVPLRGSHVHPPDTYTWTLNSPV